MVPGIDDKSYIPENEDGIYEDLIFAMAHYLGIQLYYECNHPGIMGWWWEVGNRRTPEFKYSDGYFPFIYDAILDCWQKTCVDWKTQVEGSNLQDLRVAGQHILVEYYKRSKEQKEATPNE